MTQPIEFEVCATTLGAVEAAARAGANRVELCTALDVGGVTPSAGIIGQAVRRGGIPVHVLVRPREGDFDYTAEEWEAVLADVAFCRGAGVAGVVVGALTADGQLDWPKIGAVVAAAGAMEVTLHRAFDFTTEPLAALDRLVGLGVRRVLTSGQAATAWEGRALLAGLTAHAAGRITVMPGGGVTAANVDALLRATGARAVHFSAKVRRSGMDRSLPGLEAGYWESEEKAIREIIEAGKRAGQETPVK